jgi:hypothetical protein
MNTFNATLPLCLSHHGMDGKLTPISRDRPDCAQSELLQCISAIKTMSKPHNMVA